MTTDLHDQMIDILVGADFAPADEVEMFYDLTDLATKTVDYFVGRGWNAVRIGASDHHAMTWVRWSDNEINIMATTESGVTISETRFDTTPTGIAWFTGAVAG